MEWTSLLTTLGGLLFGTGGSVLYFGPKLKEARVGAERTQTQYLEERIESLSKLYEEQGKVLDEMRRSQLQMNNTILEKDKRINQLELDNRTLKEKVDRLETELTQYRTSKS